MVRNAWELYQEYNDLANEQHRVVKCMNKAKRIEVKEHLLNLQSRILKDMIDKKYELDKLDAWGLILEYKSMQDNQLMILDKLSKLKVSDRLINVYFYKLDETLCELIKIKNKLMRLKWEVII